MKYKIRHKPPHINRLLKYKNYPPRMTDEPPRDCYPLFANRWRSWEHRSQVLYKWAMSRKQGIKLPFEQKGLWFHAE